MYNIYGGNMRWTKQQSNEIFEEILEVGEETVKLYMTQYPLERSCVVKVDMYEDGRRDISIVDAMFTDLELVTLVTEKFGLGSDTSVGMLSLSQHIPECEHLIKEILATQKSSSFIYDLALKEERHR